jgi:hypothetical protein
MTMQLFLWIRKDLQGFYWLQLSFEKKGVPGMGKATEQHGSVFSACP